ncbi:SDR family oxidoreductase [Levilactobacillus zymae]|uniref:SDR family NAD(P)-dependent oxidoreductase n=1 Tax=Levilactobacillus zymae TaxID=267363 RepID=UPI0028B3E505|nr:SDR family oxidoreductase [Levilactobacillus zymae]MDT6979635.1 SDR family oxidoreductase [Levilactobacillus zymae]
MQHQPVILITNGTRGIGSVCAADFCAQGATVIIADLEVSRGPAIAQALGENVHYLELDVTRQADWRRVIRQIMATYGHLDVLINIPNVTDQPQDWHHRSAEYLAYFERTQQRVIWGSTAAAAIMRHQYHGSIVNVLTAQPTAPNQQLVTLLHNWTQTLARDLAGNDVRINTIQAHLSPRSATQDSTIARTKPLQQTIRYLATNHPMSPTGSAFVIPTD